MKNLFPSAIIALLLGLFVQPVQGFTSLYVFGDGLSTTTNNPTASQYYYGLRRSNGRVWVEVLAQRQGLTISNNWSYFDCNSSNLVSNVRNFPAPPNAANALFVVWVNNSDLYDEMLNGNTNLAEWTATINQSQTNHFKAITNLYAKGVRTLVMPNAVDVCRVPYFAAYPATNFVRQQCIAYNTAFSNTLNQARTACPGLKILMPDFFALLNNVLTNAANYGLTNALDSHHLSIDALDQLGAGCTMNGPGANYIFWNDLNPSARFHAVIADVVQQVISPVQIGLLTVLDGSNRLDMVNMPVGLNGVVEGCTNLAMGNWVALQNITSSNLAQSVFVSTNGSSQGGTHVRILHDGPGLPGGGGGGNGTNDLVPSFTQLYRLKFPYAWNWP